MLDWFWLLLGTLRVLLHDRHALLVEYLLLRQQLAVALRARSCPRLRRRDRLFWAVVCRACADWRRHLALVRPETVLRWHRRSLGSLGVLRHTRRRVERLEGWLMPPTG